MSEETSTTTYSQHDIRSSVHESHPLTGNPKGFGLVGEETTIRRNLREAQISVSLSERTGEYRN